MAAPFPSSSRMDAWSQRRGLQNMNLRSVFTNEQQRILERYYDNGMTNQSKACFQLILQCAHESKLDFSVVRTWVGNKRRKLASKVEQNGGMSHSFSSHGLTGGLLSNHSLVGGSLSNHGLAGGALLPAELAAARNIQNRAETLSPAISVRLRTSSKHIHHLSDQPGPSEQEQLHFLAPPLQASVAHSKPPPPHVCLRAFSLHCSQEGSCIPCGGGAKCRSRGGTSQLDQAKTRVSPPVQNCGPSSEQSPRIQQVFTLSEISKGDKLKPSHASAPKSPESHRPAPHPLDASPNFSIAMETGYEEDEWQREEELANMAAQTHIHRERTPTSPSGAEVSVGRGRNTPPMTSSRPSALHGSYSVTAQTSPPRESSAQTSVGVSAAPWVISNSRKRTLQDRTQFSDGDLLQLKRYWDRGMTSLGSVCREKITAAANQLNVDTEIVKTWISNRRRKYRLMGIEIPPPKGGPAVFSTGNESPVSPDEVGLRTPELGDDLNDEGSICLSEDGTIDSHHREGDDGIDLSAAAPLANNVKIEVMDEDEEDEDDDGGDLVASDLEQMQGLLEFKHEEVQFLEIELENQKQRYDDLASFTKSLLSAVRNNDLERQQELMASLPQPSEQDWDMMVDRGAQPAAESADASSNHNGSPMTGAGRVEPPPEMAKEGVPSFTIKKDYTTTKVTEPSASEERLPEAVTEQK
ncbi:Highly divergent homeobox [Dissostichus eleginoides]|uniref:Highly divergent homeobox n=1 Tax=Dissostichus eleginoides TaxID=100907 RepID=A0AAD9CN69_DISEL|nr:Highly divergent homeobox [Dissostichus eleginoides]